jgi:hypothetical protein
LNEMKLLMLAHVVLHSDFCMGHDSIASKYRHASESRHWHWRRVCTGLPVTRRKHSGRYSDRHRKNDRDSFAFVYRLAVAFY